jgi:membrane protein YqaA with SNARE-associated domain
LFIGIKRTLSQFATWLMTLGGLGLFTIAFLDSALIPLPSGPDLVMITLSVADPSKMPLYALAATVGSTLGCTLLYLAARRAGAAALSRVSEARREKIENLLGRYDMVAVIVPALLPPPFPFKAFVLSAGVFKLKLARFIAAIFIGRAARFAVEGWLAVEFGDEARSIISQHGVKVLLVVAALALILLLARLYVVRRQRVDTACP